jgi:pimeloyl-ACP methyl ester carboxylesterase
MNTNSQDESRPTVVLVHGAFADASSWNDVIEGLQADGVRVTAPPNPLRGISIDAAYIASLLGQIPGPVLAVGHSYGGAVITNAASNAKNVVGLVYVAAFAPDEGETLADVETNSKDSVLNRRWSRSSTRPDRAQRRPRSSLSIPRRSTRSSPPTYPPNRPQ